MVAFPETDDNEDEQTLNVGDDGSSSQSTSVSQTSESASSLREDAVNAFASQTREPTMYAFTEDQLFNLIMDVASVSYHAGQYRGQFRDNLGRTQQKVVTRNIKQWWEMNREEYR